MPNDILYTNPLLWAAKDPSTNPLLSRDDQSSVLRLQMADHLARLSRTTSNGGSVFFSSFLLDIRN